MGFNSRGEEMNDKKLKIHKVKGRAMLHWVGKKPLEVVENYPTQLVETIGDTTMLASPIFNKLEVDWSNLLFHGDNKEILSTLLTNGFRGKVDLIYIDPPFDSKADYVRKIELRGMKAKFSGEGQTVIEQVQYEDIWANDNYLQFMYERLILLRELLSDKGSIYLHCDWHKDHYLRMLMDEVFGADNFLNEIIWGYTGPTPTKEYFPRKHDVILLYKKTSEFIFNADDIRIAYKASFTNVRGVHGKHEYDEGVQLKRHEMGKIPEDWWADISNVSSWRNELIGYPTQKPEALLERIIKSSSDKNSIVLDAFVGSGTTIAVAQKLGRRWIGADINKGAIQATATRLQKLLDDKSERSGVLHYRVNNYDFQQISALRSIIVEKYGVEENKTDAYFDGGIGHRIVKIAELNRPITMLDVQGIIDELKNRPDEDRDILLIGSGVEIGVEAMLLERQQMKGSLNKIEVKDIQRDGIIISEPAEADVTVSRQGNKVLIKINNYISPTIIKRLDLDRSIFGEHIRDFRSQINTILIDTNYDGEIFRVTHSDVPASKQDFIIGAYEFDLPQDSEKIAVKITDMLGEETIVVR